MNKQTRQFLTTVLLFWQTAAFPFNISGVVKDRHSGAPLPGANILLEEPNLGTTSDADGEFRFTSIPEGEASISVSFIGYQVYKTTIDVRGDTSLTIALTPRTIPGQEVVVTAERAVERETPVAFSDMKRQQIEQASWAQEIPMLLNELPNVFSYSDAGNGLGYTYLKVRGFDQKRVGVMINGIPLNDPEDHQVYWVDVPDLASNVEDIQVQRGVANSLYGVSAFGGSVNMVTSTATQQKGLHASYGLGSYNTRKFSAVMSSGLIDNTYEVYARFSRVLSDGYRDNSGVDSWSYFLAAVKYGQKTTTKINIYGGPELAYAAWDAVHEDVLKVNRTANPTSKNYKNTIDNFNQPHYELLHSWDVSDNLTLDNTLFYIKGRGYYEGLKTRKKLLDFGMNPFQTPDPLLFGADSLRYYETTEIDGRDVLYRDDNGNYTLKRTNLVRQKWVEKHQWGWLPRLHWNHGGGDLTIGGEFSNFTSDHWGKVLWTAAAPTDMSPELQYYGYNGDKTTAALYFHELFRAGEKLQLMGDAQIQYKKYRFKHRNVANFTGERRNAYTVENLFFNPKIGANYNMTHKLNLFGSFSISQREPADNDYYDAWQGPDDLGARPLFATADTVRNGGKVDFIEWRDPIIHPEKVYDYEFGLGYRTQAWHFKANAYWMDFRNEIIPYGQVDDDGNPVKGNAEKTVHRGIELSLSALLARNLQFSGNYSISDNYYSTFIYNTWDENWNVAALDYSGNAIPLFPDQLLNARLTFSPGAFNISASVQHVGKQYLDNTQRADRALDPFTVVNLTLSYRLKMAATNNVKIALFINNLFDAEYETSGYYDAWAGARFYYPAATRNYYLSLQVGI